MADLYRRTSSILILILITASTLPIIFPASSGTGTLSPGSISINQAPALVSNISITKFRAIAQLVSDYNDLTNGYNALDARFNLITATGIVTLKSPAGGSVTSSHVAFYDALANHIATYRVDTIYYNGTIIDSRGTDIEIMDERRAVVVGSVDYEKTTLLIIYIIDVSGSLSCSKAYMLPAVTLNKYTPRVEVHPRGEIYVSGSGYLDNLPISFIIVFDRACNPSRSMIYYDLDLRDIAVEELNGEYIVVTGRYVPKDMLYLGLVDPNTLFMKGYIYALPGDFPTIGLDVEASQSFITVAGLIDNKTKVSVNDVDYNGLLAGFNNDLVNLWITEMGTDIADEMFLGVDIIGDKVLAAGLINHSISEGLIYEVDKSTGYAVTKPIVYSGSADLRSLNDVDHIYTRGELRKLFAGNYTGTFPGALRANFVPTLLSYYYKASMDPIDLNYMKTNPMLMDIIFNSSNITPATNTTNFVTEPDEVLLVLNQTTSIKIPSNATCRIGFEPIIDLSTGTGQPFIAHGPGVASDPINDYPDWELVNATGNQLSQPVTVIPHAAWYNAFPHGARASWISVHATSSGTLMGSGDAWYRINFTMPANGYIELWFTGDDNVHLYLDNTQIASSNNYATLTHVVVPVSQGPHTLYAFVDDTARVVSGFIVYGWACVSVCEPTTVTETITETITKTVTDTVTVSTTRTITETSTVTQTQIETVTITETIFNTTNITVTITETVTDTVTNTITETTIITTTDTITTTSTATVTKTDTVTSTVTSTVTETSVTCCPPPNITVTTVIQQGSQQINIIIILLGAITSILLIILIIVMLRKI